MQDDDIVVSENMDTPNRQPSSYENEFPLSETKKSLQLTLPPDLNVSDLVSQFKDMDKDQIV